MSWLQYRLSVPVGASDIGVAFDPATGAVRIRAVGFSPLEFTARAAAQQPPHVVLTEDGLFVRETGRPYSEFSVEKGCTVSVDYTKRTVRIRKKA